MQNTDQNNKVKSFDEFLAEQNLHNVDSGVAKNSAGILFLYQNQILLVHPTYASWRNNPSLGIPKGAVESNEEFVDAAIREVYEEIGIKVQKSQLDPTAHTTYLYDKSGTRIKQMIYFICNVTDLSEIGLETNRVPKSQLQLEEVDWAGFLPSKEAYPLMSRSQLIILDRHLPKPEGLTDVE